MAENLAENLAGNIPHIGPMRWLNVAYAQPDGGIIGQQRIADGHPFLDHGRMPRSAIIEYIAQTAAAGISTHTAAVTPGGHISGMLIALRDVTFYGAARIGDTLNLHVAVTHRLGNMFRCHGQAFCNGKLICEGIFSFAIHGDKQH